MKNVYFILIFSMFAYAHTAVAQTTFLTGKTVNCIKSFDDGTILAGTTTGLWRIKSDGTEEEVITLTGQSINSLAVDAQGKVWVASSGKAGVANQFGGVYLFNTHLENTQLKYWSRTSGLVTNNALSIVVDKYGGVYVAQGHTTPTGGSLLIGGISWSSTSDINTGFSEVAIDGFTSGTYSCNYRIFETLSAKDDGTVWTSPKHQTGITCLPDVKVYKLDRGRQISIIGSGNFTNPQVTPLFLGTSSKTTTVKAISHFGSNNIIAISNSDISTSTQQNLRGLIIANDNYSEVSPLTPNNIGSDNNSLFLSDALINVNAITLSKNHPTIFVGTNKGLLIFNYILNIATGKYSYTKMKYNSTLGLLSNNVTSLHFDNNSKLWIGTDMGLTQLVCTKPDTDLETPVEISGTAPDGNYLPSYGFIGKLNTPNQKIISWVWDYGDGMPTNEELTHLQHNYTYNKGGIYDVKVTTTNACGISNETICKECIMDNYFRPSINGWKFENNRANVGPAKIISNPCRSPNLSEPDRVSDGTDCYGVFPTWSFYKSVFKDAKKETWLNDDKLWGGSCAGFSITSLLVFSKKINISTLSSSARTLIDVPLQTANKDLINKYQLSQSGFGSYFKDNLDKKLPVFMALYQDKPSRTLELIKKSIKGEIEHRVVYIAWEESIIINGEVQKIKSAHVLVPYKIIKPYKDKKIYRIYVYDCNYPYCTDINDSDCLANKSESLYINVNIENPNDELWAYPEARLDASSRIIPGIEYKSFYVFPGLSSLLAQPIGLITGGNTNLNINSFEEFQFISVLNSQKNDLKFTSNTGKEIGFINGSIISNDTISVPIIPTGKALKAPLGYALDKSNYSILANNYKDTANYIYLNNNLVYFDVSRVKPTLIQVDNYTYNTTKFTIKESINDSLKLYNVKSGLFDVNKSRNYEVWNINNPKNGVINFEHFTNDRYKITNTGSITLIYDGIVRVTDLDKIFDKKRINLPPYTSHEYVPNWSDPSKSYILVDVGLDGTINDTLFFQRPNSVTDIQIKNYLSISPNPTTGKVNIKQLGDPTTDPLSITITNTTGQRIWQQNFKNSRDLDNYTIDLGDKPNGIYFIKATFKDGRFQTEKVVIQH